MTLHPTMFLPKLGNDVDRRRIGSSFYKDVIGVIGEAAFVRIIFHYVVTCPNRFHLSESFSICCHLSESFSICCHLSESFSLCCHLSETFQYVLIDI